MKKKSQLRTLITVLSVLVIGIGAFLGFQPIFSNLGDGITKEFIVAIFGTVFTSLLTMFMLNKQTEIEEEKSRGESVFEERVELYKQIVSQTEQIVQDGSVSVVEMNALQFMMVKLQMVAEDATIEMFTKVYDAVSTAFSREQTSEDEELKASLEIPESDSIINAEDKINILLSMSRFASVCREELGLAPATENNSIFQATVQSLRKSQQAVEERKNVYTFANDRSASWALDNENVIVLAGSTAESTALKHNIYVCQNKRSFRPARYITFYNNNQVKYLFEITQPPADDVNMYEHEQFREFIKEFPDRENNKLSTVFYLKLIKELKPAIENDSVDKNGKPCPYTYGQPRYTTFTNFNKAKKTSEL